MLKNQRIIIKQNWIVVNNKLKLKTVLRRINAFQKLTKANLIKKSIEILAKIIRIILIETN